MEIITLQNPRIFASNCYILMSDKAFSVVDPSVSYLDAISVCPRLSVLKPEYVLLTHGHVDHFWEIESYVKLGAKVVISEKDAELISRPEMNCSAFLDGNIDSYNGELTLVKEGDTVVKGQALAEVNSEKLTNNAESEFDGVVLKILLQEDETAECGTPIAIIGQPGEAVDAPAEAPAEA